MVRVECVWHAFSWFDWVFVVVKEEEETKKKKTVFDWIDECFDPLELTMSLLLLLTGVCTDTHILVCLDLVPVPCRVQTDSIV